MGKQRRTCSSLILRKRILFCSSLRASSTSGSTHMSSRILASISPPCQRRTVTPPSSSSFCRSVRRGRVSAVGVRFPFSLRDVGSEKNKSQRATLPVNCVWNMKAASTPCTQFERSDTAEHLR
ncbi:hypothetical protein EYF80_024239 [Liparis tanakae]|uniref:Uncharacterized protein n=1 Tax=Liparis tanakae TaxID=230148 RepID=A0A4Z2HIZ0_9TELE|nr:hypothetical protein EYF80_024239 [Liparis tanakae]